MCSGRQIPGKDHRKLGRVAADRPDFPVRPVGNLASIAQALRSLPAFLRFFFAFGDRVVGEGMTRVGRPFCFRRGEGRQRLPLRRDRLTPRRGGHAAPRNPIRA